MPEDSYEAPSTGGKTSGCCAKMSAESFLDRCPANTAVPIFAELMQYQFGISRPLAKRE